MTILHVGHVLFSSRYFTRQLRQTAGSAHVSAMRAHARGAGRASEGTGARTSGSASEGSPLLPVGLPEATTGHW